VRYYKGHIALSDARDVPILLHVRNARAICFDQLCDLLSLEIITERPRSLRGGWLALRKPGWLRGFKGRRIFERQSSESRSKDSSFSNPVAITCSRCRAQRRRLSILPRFPTLLRW
jgi:hypothetical protein